MTNATFEIGKTYQGYEVTHRTPCFVYFDRSERAKVKVLDGIEIAKVLGSNIYSDSIDTPVTESLPCDVEVYEPLTDTNIETVITGGGVDWKLVSVDDKQICTLEAYREPREIGYAPRTAQIHVSTLQAIMGWDNEDEDDDFEIIEPDPIDDGEELDLEILADTCIPVSHSRGWAHGTTWKDNIPELEILEDNKLAGYAIGEPIWFGRTDDISNAEHQANMAAIDAIRMRDARMNNRQADMQGVHECQLSAY